jgi:hypothetical protein
MPSFIQDKKTVWGKPTYGSFLIIGQNDNLQRFSRDRS